jgi:hypothetical protein
MPGQGVGGIDISNLPLIRGPDISRRSDNQRTSDISKCRIHLSQLGNAETRKSGLIPAGGAISFRGVSGS